MSTITGNSPGLFHESVAQHEVSAAPWRQLVADQGLLHEDHMAGLCIALILTGVILAGLVGMSLTVLWTL